jgi:hypothetical protein
MQTQTKPMLTAELEHQVPALDSYERAEAMRLADEIVELSAIAERAAAKARVARARREAAIAQLPEWMKEIWRQTTGTNHTIERAGLCLASRN